MEELGDRSFILLEPFKFGCTFLQWALSRRKYEIATVVISYMTQHFGIDRCNSKLNSEIPLHMIIESLSSQPEATAVFYQLLRLGANPNAIGFGGFSALHLAISMQNQIASISMLLRSGADPDQIDVRGQSCVDLCFNTNTRFEITELVTACSNNSFRKSTLTLDRISELRFGIYFEISLVQRLTESLIS